MVKMKNFDYKNSRARKIYLSKKSFSANVFIALTFISIILVIVGLYLFVLKNYGLGQIVLAIALFFESIILAKRFYRPKLTKGENIVDYFSTELIGFFEKLIRVAKKEGMSEISSEYVFNKIDLSNIGSVIFTRMGIPQEEKKNLGKNLSQVNFEQKFIDTVCKLRIKNEIEVEDLLLAIFQSSQKIKDYLKSQNIEDQLRKKIFGSMIRLWLESGKNGRMATRRFYQIIQLICRVIFRIRI
jgi:hypothetical protein